jgi:hypothetical protein
MQILSGVSELQRLCGLRQAVCYGCGKAAARGQTRIRPGRDRQEIYGIAETDITLVAHADGSRKTMKANKGWLLHQQPSGEWLIKRAMWNYQ